MLPPLHQTLLGAQSFSLWQCESQWQPPTALRALQRETKRQRVAKELILERSGKVLPETAQLLRQRPRPDPPSTDVLPSKEIPKSLSKAEEASAAISSSDSSTASDTEVEDAKR